MTTRSDVCTVKGEKRVAPVLAPGAERVKSFDEAEPTLTLAEASYEALRCTVSSPCLYCDVCRLMCPDLAITRDSESGEILIDLDFCKGCGLCAHYCPRGAIEMVLDE